MKQLLIILSITMFGFCQSANAQQLPTVKELAKEIAQQDSIMFTAFNNRDTALFNKMFSTDLEFFHDKGGLTSYSHTVNFLKKLKEETSDLKRELLTETLEVFPIPDYGAMEIGQHRFVHTENGKTETAVFKFVHIWRKQNDQWQVTRVVSYDH